MAYSTANWHWKNKTVTPWAKEWFERELTTIKVEGSDGAVVSVKHVIEVDGDVELGRRKSKYVRAISLSSLSSATPRGRAHSLPLRCEASTTRLTCVTCRLITIYDCKVVLRWKGTAADGTEAEGKLTIPEISHEITLDGLSDYTVCDSFHARGSPVASLKRSKTVSMVSHVRVFARDYGTLRACEAKAPDSSRDKICCFSGRFG